MLHKSTVQNYSLYCASMIASSLPLSQIYEIKASINGTVNAGIINGKVGKGKVCKRAK